MGIEEIPKFSFGEAPEPERPSFGRKKTPENPGVAQERLNEINERIEYLIAMGITPEDKQQPESEFNRLSAEKEALKKTLASLD